MRTLGTFLAVGILALAVGCGSSSSSGGSGGSGGSGSGSGGSGSGDFTSTTGRTASSGGASCKNQTCAAEDDYYTCLKGNCDAQAKTCFGSSFASGAFGGTCKDYIACNMSCPCDATGPACFAACFLAASDDCRNCLVTIQACAASSACVQATCTNDSGTATDDGSAATGTNCAAVQACCASLASTAAQQCQAALTAAGTNDALCAQILAVLNSGGGSCQ
jgi:hypothetical protein